MRRRVFTLGLLAFLLVAPTERKAVAESAPPFVVIIDSKNPYTTLDREFITDAFLKKATRWPNGDVIKPVDLPGSSPVRERFSNDVLKRSVSAVKSYWQQIIFSGRDVPPSEVATDDDVVKYVTTHPGAIGYVSGTARLGDARVVTVKQ